MNKKILMGLIALTLAVPSTSHANLKNRTTDVPTLAILDTALDTSIPAIKGKLLHEACILEWTTCPNGQAFMEGPGSATLPLSLINKNGFDHGTKMASAAIAANPNMNIVFVRIIGQNINGDRQLSTDQTLNNALDWVYLNKDKFNIKALVMSQGHHNLAGGTDYCPKTPVTESKIRMLSDLNIPSFFPTGNNRDYVKIDWPACIPSAISVGSGSKNGIDLYSNYDKALVDLHAIGNAKVTAPGGSVVNGAGTSISAQIAAANWIALKQAKPSYNVSQIYDLIIKTSKPIKGKQGTGNLFQLDQAING